MAFNTHLLPTPYLLMIRVISLFLSFALASNGIILYWLVCMEFNTLGPLLVGSVMQLSINLVTSQI